MADEHYRWLDRDAAERLLRGEPLEAVSGEDARRAGELAATLDALTALSAAPASELPGEDAALKAFREARAVSAVDGAVSVTGRRERSGRPGASPGRHRAAALAGPAGNRPLWGRPVRFGLAAAVAACMVGGVAVAAGTGVLPSPFGGRDEPVPASSVSAAGPDESPSASPHTTAGGDEALPDGSASPDGGASGSPEGDRGGTVAGNKGASSSPDPKATGGAGGSTALRRELAKVCLKYRGGGITSDEKRRLRDSAEAAGRTGADIDAFCDRVLGRTSGSGTVSGGSAEGSDGRDGGQDTEEDGEELGGDGNGKGGGSGDNVGYHTLTPGVTPSQSADASPSSSAASPSVSASS
ncbi:hypothetical protein [Streptomyces sp. VRA16 Mangrove soil]|uniref:hypothetical protein n=1 Tax=Streptomyces sp. VRA16 Mangrove soil TaxID=2817434 RepID=UPI001A9CF888|nr:hypothetical protein [Streptomyces sp. VRA16 Mangrove soil]MBO1334821.1 hypothetical protein [Streptomyces sp. VRA16 Mangrove soil]